MDKQLVIDWLASYTSPIDSLDEDAALLAQDLELEIEEAKTMVIELEVRLTKLFETWQEDVLLETSESKGEGVEETEPTKDA